MKELNVVDWASQRPPICLRDAADKIKHERQTPRTSESSRGRVDAFRRLERHVLAGRA